MKKTGIALIIISIIFLTCVFAPDNVWAESSAAITVTTSNITVGSKVNVTLSISAGNETLQSLEISLNYDDSIIKFVSGAGFSGTGGVIRGEMDFKGAAEPVLSKTFTLTFDAIKAGTSNISIDSQSYVETSGGTSTPNASASIIVKDNNPEKSSNANLKSLTISQGKLSPLFSAGVTEYAVSVENSIKTLTLSAVAAHDKATVSIKSSSGDTSLVVGKNTRTITVTAEDGTTKKYTITITRAGAASPTPTKAQSTTPPKTPGGTNSPSATAGSTETSGQFPTETLAPTVTAPAVSPTATADGIGQSDNNTFNNIISGIIKWVVIIALVIVAVMFITVYIIKSRDRKRKNVSLSKSLKKSAHRSNKRNNNRRY